MTTTRKTNPTTARFDPTDEGLDMPADYDLPDAKEVQVATGNGTAYRTTVTYEVTVAVPDAGPLTLGILRALLDHPDISVLPDTYTAGLGRPPSSSTAAVATGHALRVTSQQATPLTADTPIEDLDLSVRTYNCLKREGVHTVGSLCQVRASALREIRNFNERSVLEVISALGKAGLSLAPEYDDDPLLTSDLFETPTA